MEECYNNNICIRFERNSTVTLICHANNLNKHSNDVSANWGRIFKIDFFSINNQPKNLDQIL